MKSLRTLLLAPLAVLSLAGCDGTAGDDGADPTLHLTGTEESPLAGAGPGGGQSCKASKVLVCHVPPGNPANAHTICVGAPAVKAHLSHHPDYLGACGPAADAGNPTVPPPPPPPPPAEPDAGQPACTPFGSACGDGLAACCAGSQCIANVCDIQVL